MTKNDTVLFNSHLTLSGYDNARSLTIIQSDDTVLEFTLRDKNLEPIILTEKVGQAQIIDSKRNALVATFDVQVDGSEATFSIDKILPVADYELYIKIGNQYFPSKEQSFLLRVIKAYDVVDDIDLNSRTTIDIVVDALKDDVISTLKEQVEAQVDAIIKADPAKFKGEKGDKFTRDDFTQEDWLSLRGEDAVPLKPSQLSGSELELIRGHSAYQVAVNEGFAGTEAEWLESLKGEKGDKGDSAYEEALKNGFEGTEAEWLESLKGDKGDKGDKFTRDDFTEEDWLSLKGEDAIPLRPSQLNDSELELIRGYSAYQVALNEGFEGTEKEWLATLKGEKGDKPTRKDFTEEEWASLKGEDGNSLTFEQLSPEQQEALRGYSAYQIAVNKGFEGDVEQWLESLKGEKGDKFTRDDFTGEEWLSLKGEKGDKGDTGDSAYEEALKNGFVGSEVEWLESLKGDSFEYEDFTKEQLDELRGETGQAFTFEMFTPAQLNDLRLAIINTELTENGDTLVTFSDGTTIIVQRGQKGESGINGLHGNTTSIENNEDGSYDIVVTNPNSETEIYRATIRDGVDGADGADGESLRYEDLTPEQIAELQEGLPVRPPKIYTREEYEALESYDPHTIYIVREA